jgi:hypothetical protein
MLEARRADCPSGRIHPDLCGVGIAWRILSAAAWSHLIRDRSSFIEGI